MTERKSRLWEIVGILVFALGLMMILALVSYDPADPPGASVVPANARALNKCGYAGAFFSSVFFRYIGVLPSYLLVLVFAGWGLSAFFDRPPKTPGLKIGGWLFLIVALASFEALTFNANAWLGRLSGGTVGTFLSENVLLENFNRAGAYLVLTAVAIAAAMVATDNAPAKLVRVIEYFRGSASEAEDVAVEEPPKRRRRKAAKEEDDEAVEADVEADDGDEEIRKIEAQKKRIEKLIKKKESEAKKAEKKEKKKSEKKPAGKDEPEEPQEEYRLPPLETLEYSTSSNPMDDESIIRKNTEILEKTFAEFNVQAEVVEIERGPVITMYEMRIGAGIRLTKVTGLSDNVAMALRAPSVRIVAPIPGKDTVGIEVPNSGRDVVRMRDMIEKSRSKMKDYYIPLFLGKDTKGLPIIADLSRLPHLLIAGTTGSGKSVCINSIILSILYTKKPDEIKLILVDPKRVELSLYEDIPHLLHPVVTDMKKAQAVLEWAVKKMEDRYVLLEAAGVKHINSYNALSEQVRRERCEAKLDEGTIIPRQLPFVVIIIDELADLMMVASKEVETAITRLTQKSRAVGIHLVIATQRPSVDVITGLIKSNMPSRIAFEVSNSVDSRTILDEKGAEKLLGQGDMLYSPPGSKHPARSQGSFVSEKEINQTVHFVKNLARPEYSEELAKWQPSDGSGPAASSASGDGGEDDPSTFMQNSTFVEGVDLILREDRASITLLQMRLKIGYAHAARIIDQMEQAGIVGPHVGSKPREILISAAEWEEMKAQIGE